MMREESKVVTVSFLDVGQGDSAVVIFPNRHRAAIVDVGDTSTVLKFLEKHGISAICYLIISHFDVDHAEGAADLINQFSGEIGCVYYNWDRLVEPGRRKRSFRLLLQDLLDVTNRRGVNISDGRPDIPVPEVDRVRGKMLHPTKADLERATIDEEPNEGCIVVLLEFEGWRVLLGADVGTKGWDIMARRGEDLRAHVLKYPHHGSWVTLGEARVPGEMGAEKLLRMVSPRWVVISVGSTNPHGHPSPNTLELIGRREGVRVLCTEATDVCIKSVDTARSKVLNLVSPECRPAYSENEPGACPCAGTVTIRMTGSGVKVIPDPDSHLRIMRCFESPSCLPTAIEPKPRK